tara:strand:- start:183 stop:1358 length:1176 start_codon:yes stop_codon:yes gene_type:complete
MGKPADFVVDNASGSAVRTDLNDLFDAISINNGFTSGAPTTKYKYMWYADTSANKMSFYKANATDKIDFIHLENGNFFGPNGSASSPSYTFTNSTSTGFYRSNNNEIGVSNGGANTALFKSTGTDIKGVLSVAPASGEAYIQVQTNSINNQNSYIDFVADTTYTDYGLRLLRGDTGANSISQLVHRGTGDLQIQTNEVASIALRTTAADRWKINSDGGFIWAGHTGGIAANVGLSGDIIPRGIVSKQGSAASASTSGQLYNFYWTGSALQCWIDQSNQGSVSLSSDYRVKKDITTQTALGIDKIKQLRPVNYEFTDNASLNFKADGVKREGFIAHEVAEVIPSAVDGEKDAVNQVQSLRLDAIVSVLTKALQEAVAKIETLEAKVAVLEGS